MQNTSCKMPGWMTHKLESRLPGEISKTSCLENPRDGVAQSRTRLKWLSSSSSKIGRWHHPNGRKWGGNKEPLDESERGEWKGWLETFKNLKIMASGPIISWQIDGETVETVTDFILRGSKITADGDCSHEIKRCLLLGEGNGNPLQCSCLENPRDGGAW